MIELFFIALFVAVSVATFAAVRPDGIGFFVFLSSGLKLALCVAGLFVVLPFAGEDTVTFEATAAEWSKLRFSDLLKTFDLSRSHVFSSIIAVLYWLLERNIAIPVFFNGIVGVLIFYFSHVLVKNMWPGAYIPRVFYLVLAFHPMLAVNSAVVLRENLVILFLILACIFLVRFAQSPSFSRAILFSLMIGLSTVFHGGMIFFVAGVPLFLIITRGRNLALRVAGVLFIVGAFVTAFSVFEISKLSEIREDGLTDEVLIGMDSRRREAGTAYLTGMSVSGPVDLVWQLPVRSVFLLLTPFPWQIGSVGHLIVAFEALYWWVIIWLTFRNFRNVWSNPGGRIVFLCVLFVLLAFSFGTSNFGTAVRHRTKFILLGLSLVAPFLPSFRFSIPR